MSIITDNLIEILLKKPETHIVENKTYKYVGKGGEGYIYEFNNNIIKIYIKYNIDSVLKEFYITGLLQELPRVNFNVVIIKNYYLSLSNPVMVMEKMDGNLGDFVNKIINNSINSINNDDLWYSLIFQSMAGFDFLNRKLNILHNDAKIKNILYKKNTNTTQKEELYRIYKINNTSYKVPIDYIFKIADFGFIQIIGSTLNKMTDSEIKEKIKNREDFREISKIIQRIIVNYMIKEYTYDEVLNFALKYPNFDKLYKEQVRNINIDLKSYPEYIKKNFIFRFICYYLTENDNSYSDIIKFKYKINLPNQKIQNILNNIMTADDPFKLFDMFII